MSPLDPATSKKNPQFFLAICKNSCEKDFPDFLFFDLIIMLIVEFIGLCKALCYSQYHSDEPDPVTEVSFEGGILKTGSRHCADMPATDTARRTERIHGHSPDSRHTK